MIFSRLQIRPSKRFGGTLLSYLLAILPVQDTHCFASTALRFIYLQYTMLYSVLRMPAVRCTGLDRSEGRSGMLEMVS